MHYLMGLDIGTTAVKAIIVDKDGEMVVKSTISYGLLFPQPGWVEQDAEEMWRAVCDAVEQALSRFPYDKRQITALSLSTQRDTMVCVDAANRPIRNAITWMDARSVDQCARLEKDIGAKRVYDITGVGVNTIWTFAFILWMKENEPEVFAKTACFGLVHDFVLCRLGASTHYLDDSNACQTMLYDYRAGRWDPELMRYGALTPERLPELVSPGERVGRISPELAQKWGLSGDLALVSGGGDQQCAALGAGAFCPGDVEIGIGTAANILAVTDSPFSDPKHRVICHRAAVKGRFVLEGAMLAMGRMIEWLKTEIFPYASLQEIDAMIEKESQPGAGGIIALAHFEGAACPYWNPKATGVLYGLRLSSGKGDVARALMESTAFEIKKCLDLLDEFGICPDRVRISGGASRSDVWMQIMADVLGVRVQIPDNTECAALGAAILAGIGDGTNQDVQQAVRRAQRVSREYVPRRQYREVYDTAYEANKALYIKLNV